LNNRALFHRVNSYFCRVFLITKGFAMFLQLHSQRARQRDSFSRLADWWPAALIGLVALLGALPDSNAQTLLGL
jgi:hypothetical protein